VPHWVGLTRLISNVLHPGITTHVVIFTPKTVDAPRSIMSNAMTRLTRTARAARIMKRDILVARGNDDGYKIQGG
jgi:hypothetical protein